MTYRNYIQEYVDAIESGEVIVGEYIKQIYSLLIERINNGTYILDLNKADKAVTFAENYIHHCEGALAPNLISLELWQKATLSVIFGIVDKEGLRQWREVLMVMGRKNGKSLFACIIIGYMAYLDGEYGAKVYCIAPKLEQARIVYDNFYKITQSEPELEAISHKRRSDIYIDLTNTTIKPLCFSSKKSDGLNPHCTICDEISSWQGEQGLKQYEVLKSALGARKQPLIFNITTSGYVNDSIYDELIKRCTQVLNGTSEESRLLPLLYMIDDIDKWDDINELKKANPNMNVSVSQEFFEEEIKIAKNSMSKHNEFMTKYCCVKQSSTASWLPYEVIDGCCGDEFGFDDFRNSYCVGGIDLSQTTDLTACCVAIEKNENIYVLSQFFMPANKIAEAQERENVPYDLFVKQGWVKPSGDNFIDYHDCFQWFVDLVEKYEIYPLQIGYDRYSAQYLIQDLRAYGFHCDDVYQGFNLSGVCAEMEGQLRDGSIRLGNNTLLKAHFMDTAMKHDAESRKQMPCKAHAMAHIDGFVSVIDAMTVRQKWYEQIGEQLKNA